MLHPPFLLLFLHLSYLLASFARASVSATSTGRPPTSTTQPTVFHVASGANENYFYRDNVTTAQLLLTSAASASPNTTRRLVAALPAGNNGALVYFLPIPHGSHPGPPPPIGGNPPSPAVQPLNINLINGTLQSTVAPDGNSGIQADVSFSTSATLGVTIVGAVRALRGKN